MSLTDFSPRDHDVMYHAFINGITYSPINGRRYHYLCTIVTVPIGTHVSHHHSVRHATARTRRKAAARLRMQYNRWLFKVSKGNTFRYQYNSIP